jgi:hypothetical protein
VSDPTTKAQLPKSDSVRRRPDCSADCGNGGTLWNGECGRRRDKKSDNHGSGEYRDQRVDSAVSHFLFLTVRGLAVVVVFLRVGEMTVIEMTPVSDIKVPSLTVYVNASAPRNPRLGVYTRFGARPDRLPFSGKSATE